MNHVFISISVAEYKELLEMKIRAEMEAAYQTELKKLKDELDLEKSGSSYWYGRAQELEEKLKKYTEPEGGEA